MNADAEKSKWLNHEGFTKSFEGKAELKAEIERWTSSKSPVHYFVKEVSVGLKDFDMPEGVVFIDTPGLNDVVEFRSNITRQYINRANAVFMCVKSDSLTGDELKTLYRVFTNTHGKVNKVYVIGTQLDTLNEPKEDWALQSKEWTKYLEEPSCYGDKKLVETNLIPVSGFLYSLLEDYRAGRLDDDKNFDLESALLKLRIRRNQLDERFDELEDFTNIKFLYKKIQSEVVDKYKSELLDDIRRAYENCQFGLKKVLGDKKVEQEKVIRDSQLNIDEIRGKLEKQQAELEQVQKDKSDLETFVKQLKAETSKRVEEVITAIKGR